MFGQKKFFKPDATSMFQGVNLVCEEQPHSAIAEQYRMVRTNLLYAQADKSLRALMFTSAMPSEGKSTVSANMAVTFANAGLKTLLVDADTRRPTVHATFSVMNHRGLVDLLTVADHNHLAGYLLPTTVPNLTVLPAGPTPPNPSELLGSQRMSALIERLNEEFDVVVFDAPPLDPVTDAAVLASKLDGVVLVVPYGLAQKHALIAAKAKLDHIQANVVGVVHNRTPKANAGYEGVLSAYYK